MQPGEAANRTPALRSLRRYLPVQPVLATDLLLAHLIGVVEDLADVQRELLDELVMARTDLALLHATTPSAESPAVLTHIGTGPRRIGSSVPEPAQAADSPGTARDASLADGRPRRPARGPTT